MVDVRQIGVRLGDFHLDDVSLRVEECQYLAVLGPTGAGKTVLLECIAGLVRPEKGDIWIGGERVTDWPPERRRVGYLPQDYALFPHLSVRENLAFGLTVRRRQGEAASVVGELSEVLGIGHLLDRGPSTLSGGEKQRVALGRALATKPAVMLLDEPLSALDEATRDTIGTELRRIHDRMGISTIHICHSFDETLRLADRVVLVRDGRVVQTGPPMELLRRPNSAFGARFVRAENIIEGMGGQAADGSPVFRSGDVELRLAGPVSGRRYAVIRPDEVSVLEPAEAPPVRGNLLCGTVRTVEERRTAIAIGVEGPLSLTAMIPRPQWRKLGLRVGDPVRVAALPESVHTFAAEGNEAG